MRENDKEIVRRRFDTIAFNIIWEIIDFVDKNKIKQATQYVFDRCKVQRKEINDILYKKIQLTLEDHFNDVTYVSKVTES